MRNSGVKNGEMQLNKGLQLGLGPGEGANVLCFCLTAVQEKCPRQPVAGAPSPGESGPCGGSAVLEGRLLLEVSSLNPLITRKVTVQASPQGPVAVTVYNELELRL